MRRSLIIAALLAALPAHADVWKRASEPPDPAIQLYTDLMIKGDDAVLMANGRSIAAPLAVKTVDLAIEAYRAAAKARPDQAEPWFRIASTLDSFYFDGCDDLREISPPKTCDATHVDRNAKSRELLDAWDQFEAISPLDPRVNEMLNRRAILRTKQLDPRNPEPLLRAVIKDYEALLDRQDGMLFLNLDGILGNLAETYLMLGEIEEAVSRYVLAVKAGGGVSTVYGLAVALDRQARGDLALEVIRSQGLQGKEDFERLLDRSLIFFVPDGEVHYYRALADEAWGDTREAIVNWKRYIASGAHKQYQPRAREHLDKLQLRGSFKIEVPLSKDLDDDTMIRPKRLPGR